MECAWSDSILKSHDTKVDTTTTFLLFYSLFYVQPRARFQNCDRPVFFVILNLVSFSKLVSKMKADDTFFFYSISAIF